MKKGSQVNDIHVQIIKIDQILNKSSLNSWFILFENYIRYVHPVTHTETFCNHWKTKTRVLHVTQTNTKDKGNPVSQSKLT